MSIAFSVPMTFFKQKIEKGVPQAPTEQPGRGAWLLRYALCDRSAAQKELTC
jgi:predicted RNA-binding protein YlxR (DUF448 family)